MATDLPVSEPCRAGVVGPSHQFSREAVLPSQKSAVPFPARHREPTLPWFDAYSGLAGPVLRPLRRRADRGGFPVLLQAAPRFRETAPYGRSPLWRYSNATVRYAFQCHPGIAIYLQSGERPYGAVSRNLG